MLLFWSIHAKVLDDQGEAVALAAAIVVDAVVLEIFRLRSSALRSVA